MRLCLFTSFFILCFSSSRAQFVLVQNGRFILNKKPYTFVGTNYWYGSLLPLEKGKAGIERLQIELDFLQSQNITNLRIIAGAEGRGKINGIIRIGPSLQPHESIFDNKVAYGLDELLFEMQKRKMKAVIYLSNNWEWSGGFLQYLKWDQQIADSVFEKTMSWDEMRDEISKFYNCKKCTQVYFDQVQFIVNRKNTFSNILYKNDPTIMAWEIANEPRPMRPASITAYKEFIKLAAATIKKLDSKHLVTTGTEGYIGTENMEVYKAIHADKNIDYLTIHIWPKNWAWYTGVDLMVKMDSILDQTGKYLDEHLGIAKALNKPLVVEEFGLPRDQNSFDKQSSTNARDVFFNFILRKWRNVKGNDRYLAGINFWAYGGVANPIKNQIFWKNGDDYMGDPPMEPQGLYSVFNCDTGTWEVISRFQGKGYNEKVTLQQAHGDKELNRLPGSNDKRVQTTN
ncbi:MAG: glycoside hydrolase 5 family protein [Ginsengibacter sp.]